jgi:hypothetical protein
MVPFKKEGKGKGGRGEGRTGGREEGRKGGREERRRGGGEEERKKSVYKFYN